MNNIFKESFNYLVTFLAVLFGLGAFKDELSTIKIFIIGKDFNILELSIPFVAFILVATYFGALAMVAKNFTFRPFPLTKILERISYSLAFLGLIYPLILVLVLFVSYTLSSVSQVNVNTIALFLSVLGLLAGFYTSYRFANIRLRDRYEAGLSELRKIVVETEAINLKKPSSYEVVMLFHQFSTLSKAILRLKGYGYANDDSYLLGKTLESIGVFNKKDLELVQRLRRFRNRIAHEQIKAKDSELKKARLELEQLISKIKDEILNLESNVS